MIKIFLPPASGPWGTERQTDKRALHIKELTGLQGGLVKNVFEYVLNIEVMELIKNDLVLIHIHDTVNQEETCIDPHTCRMWPVYEITVAPSLKPPGTLQKKLRNINVYVYTLF